MRRTSEYIRSRDSAFLVQEARGVPFTILSLLLGVNFGFLGFRYIFYCGEPFTSDPSEEAFLAIFKDCKSDPFAEAWSGVIGAVCFVHAAVRFAMAATKKTAELYHLMLFVTGYDFMLALLTIRVGLGLVPLYYIIMVATMVVYESTVLYMARRAYLVRSAMKEE
mmetsp:Transcript_12052/g.19008  ORF Transcript_12052/g.19008 Transcript_12052/m.19008 type:complete len:165 (-) Transcript_12052:132-626(-)